MNINFFTQRNIMNKNKRRKKSKKIYNRTYCIKKLGYLTANDFEDAINTNKMI